MQEVLRERNPREKRSVRNHIIWLSPKRREMASQMNRDIWVLGQKIMGQRENGEAKILDNPDVSYNLFLINRPTEEERKLRVIGQHKPDLKIFVARKFDETLHRQGQEIEEEHLFYPGFAIRFRTIREKGEMIKKDLQELDMYELSKFLEILEKSTQFGEKTALGLKQ